MREELLAIDTRLDARVEPSPMCVGKGLRHPFNFAELGRNGGRSEAGFDSRVDGADVGLLVTLTGPNISLLLEKVSNADAAPPRNGPFAHLARSAFSAWNFNSLARSYSSFTWAGGPPKLPSQPRLPGFVHICLGATAERGRLLGDLGFELKYGPASLRSIGPPALNGAGAASTDLDLERALAIFSLRPGSIYGSPMQLGFGMENTESMPRPAFVLPIFMLAGPTQSSFFVVRPLYGPSSPRPFPGVYPKYP
jgi:hypothetical protein